jgi:N-terminal domain of anti-restriction factor ArdC
MKKDREQIQQEALSRAAGGIVLSNYPAIFEGFTRKGISESEIKPRENVFTFNAWKALGRYVRKGEHGVKVCTYAPVERKEIDPKTGTEKIVEGKRPWMATVFHISQTEPMGGNNAN